MRSGFLTYTPDFTCDYDLLLFDTKSNTYKRVYVAKVSDQKPIIVLKTTRQGTSAIRAFDLLIAIHPASLACWIIPASDIPDTESLYLGKKYSSYYTSLLTPQELNIDTTRDSFDSVRKVKKESIQEIKKQQSIESISMDDIINDVLGDI